MLSPGICNDLPVVNPLGQGQVAEESAEEVVFLLKEDAPLVRTHGQNIRRELLF